MWRGPETREINRGASLSAATSSLAGATGANAGAPPAFTLLEKPKIKGDSERQTIMMLLLADICVHKAPPGRPACSGSTVGARAQPVEPGGDQQVGGGDGVASLPQVKGNLASCGGG